MFDVTKIEEFLFGHRRLIVVLILILLLVGIIAGGSTVQMGGDDNRPVFHFHPGHVNNSTQYFNFSFPHGVIVFQSLLSLWQITDDINGSKS